MKMYLLAPTADSLKLLSPTVFVSAVKLIIQPNFQKIKFVQQKFTKFRNFPNFGVRNGLKSADGERELSTY